MEAQEHEDSKQTIDMVERSCQNPKCDEKFFTDNPAKKYCSNRCRVAAQRHSLKGHSESVNREEKETTLPARLQMDTSKSMSFSNFPEAAQYIIGDLQDKIKDLKAEKLKLEEKYEELEGEFADLEETLQNTKGLLDKKPSALAGWVENPDKILQMMAQAPEALRGLRDVIREFASQPPAINGVQKEEEQKNDILFWLAGKPLEVQQKFVNMVAGFSQVNNDDELMNWIDFMLLKLPNRKAS